MRPKIVIAGGTGFIGRYLAKWYAPTHEVVILSRQQPAAGNNAFQEFTVRENMRLVQWDGKSAGEWVKELDGAEMVINLAGKSVNCRYTKKNKQEIFDSRTNASKAIAQAIREVVTPPKLWVNAASATIYRHATDRPQDEFTGEMHNDFSVQVCKLWEKTFFEERTPFTRKVALRMAITLGPGGVMVPFLNLVKFGLGGRQGSGSQMFSWVHIDDVCRVIDFVKQHDELEGVFNVAAPGAVTNAEFMRLLRQVTGHKIGLPAYEWMLKVGAIFIGTETELILKSRWVKPSRLTNEGFTFRYPGLQQAMEAIIRQLPRKQYHLF
ncbi:TIGR01777 family oxidoreductase [Aridibaculum aurantiacum]|uniref:TIGR01777 family oxidoreductase n=1 Tax=Aridibaculum aurantiacum TaxID=2810307 RepID=UPI001A97040F|nr:TIGR01777 family oxidoreductase [Aridibaculum aurantiacum]